MSYKVYPITQTELNYEGYEIKIKGTAVKPDTARVSAIKAIATPMWTGASLLPRSPWWR